MNQFFAWRATLLAAFLALPAGAQQIIYVNASAPAGGDGASWATAFNDLTAGLTNAPGPVGGVELWLATGVYTINLTGNSFLLQNALAVYGGFAGTETSRDQRNWTANPTLVTNAIFATAGQVVDRSAIVDGLIFTNSTSAPIQVSANGSPTIANCVFAGLPSEAVLDAGGSPLCTNCVFTGNLSGAGMGVAVEQGGAGIYIDCTFTQNSATALAVTGTNPAPATVTVERCQFAGNNEGIDSFGGNITVSNCLFTNNALALTADNDGTVPPGSVTVSQSQFLGNDIAVEMSSQNGLPEAMTLFVSHSVFQGSLTAALELTNITTVIQNSLLSGNVSALQEQGGNVVLQNVTVTGNGSGIGNLNDEGGLDVYNSVVWANAADSSPFTTSQSNLVQAVNGSDPIFVSPIDFTQAPIVGGNFMPSPCSPLIAAGDPAAAPTDPTDLAGQPRFIFSQVDIGAYEFQGTPAPALSFSQSPLNQVGNETNAVSFSVTPIRAVSSYQWQRRPAGANAFVNLIDNTLYSGSQTAVLTVSGITPALNADEYRCVITSAEGCSLASSAATLSYALPPAQPVIVWNPLASISYLTALGAAQLNATANVPGTFTYTPGAGAVLNAGSQPIIASFIPTDTADYTTASATNFLVVTPAAQVVNFASLPDITFTPSPLALSASVASGLPITFNVLSGPAVVSGNSLTLSGPGLVTVQANQAGNLDYAAAASVTQSFQVRALPAITWSTPAPIHFGFALGNAQLNATANVPGSFVYNPPPGTVLPPGPASLSVQFTPDDTVNNTNASASVPLTVLPAVQATTADDQALADLGGPPLSLVLTGTDPNQADLNFAVVGSPAHGSLSGIAPNLVYTPAAGFAGADSFTFQTSDVYTNSPTATISLQVELLASIQPLNASSVTATNAVLNATVNPNNADTLVYFAYGLGTNYGTTNALLDVGNGVAPVVVSNTIAGLSLGTVYHYQLVASNAVGQVAGPDVVFTAILPAPPLAVTLPSDVLAHGAGGKVIVLHGLVFANGADTVVHFDYGPDTNYGSTTGLSNAGTFAGSSLAVSNSLAQLIYGDHYRLSASNSAGVSVGADSVVSPAPNLDNNFIQTITAYGNAWGDFNNSGSLDLLESVSGVSLKTLVLQNTGGGNFTDIGAGLPGVDPGALIWADFFNTGHLDALLAGYDNNNQGICQIWHNQGDDTFALANSGLPQIAVASAAVADFDNDGKMDVLLSGYAGKGGITQIWRNQGDGTFAQMTLPDGLATTRINWVGLADFDGDGLTDILLAGLDGNFVNTFQLWRNLGHGSFASVGVGLPQIKIDSVAVGDLDADGQPDIVYMGYDPTVGNEVTRVLRNVGNLTFTNSNPRAIAATGVLGSVALGDFDNDGQLDVLVLGQDALGNPHTDLWLNQGGGLFAEGFTGFTPFYDGFAAFGDYDHDGRLDLLFTGDSDFDTVELWHNNAAVTNTPPTAPTQLQAAPSGLGVVLTWNAGSDAQTPAAALSYNVRIGTTSGGVDVLSPEANPNGTRLVPAFGNAQQRLFLLVTNLAIGQRYYWSVQSIDTAFAGSTFAAENTFALPPVALPDFAAVLPGQSVIVPVLQNDITGTNDVLTIVSVTTPAHGNVWFTATNVTYFNDGSSATNDAFTYTIQDSLGNAASAVVSITIGQPGAIVTVRDDSGPGSLRDALAQAAIAPPGLGFVVQFDPSLAGQVISLTSLGDQSFGPSALLVGGQVTLDGSAAPGLALSLDPSAPAMRLLHVAPGATLVVTNLMLENGLAIGGSGANGGGGGAGFGGAVYNEGNLTLVNVLLTNNQANGGNGGDGGLGPTSGGQPNGSGDPAASPTFGGGMAGVYPCGGAGGMGGGGAIFNNGGIVQLTGCLLVSNSAAAGLSGNGTLGGLCPSINGQGLGGGLFNLSGLAIVSNCVFTNDMGDLGAAICNYGDAPGFLYLYHDILTNTGLSNDLFVTNSLGSMSEVVEAGSIIDTQNSPWIAPIVTQGTLTLGQPVAVGVTVYLPAGDPSVYTVTASSDNQTLIPNANLNVAPNGANWILTIQPPPGQGGTANLTVTVSNGSLAASASFNFEVGILCYLTSDGPDRIINGLAEPGVTVEVQSTADVVNGPWSNLAPAVETSPGLYQYRDLAAAAATRFYRMVAQ